MAQKKKLKKTEEIPTPSQAPAAPITAPTQAQPTQSAQPQQAQPVKKSNTWMFCCGCCGCLVVILILITIALSLNFFGGFQPAMLMLRDWGQTI